MPQTPGPLTDRSSRGAFLVVAALLLPSCVAMTVPDAPARPGPSAALTPMPEPVPAPPSGAQGVRGPACGGVLTGASVADVFDSGAALRLRLDPTLAQAFGEAGALGFALLGEGGGCAPRAVSAPADDAALLTLAALTAVLDDVPLLAVDGAQVRRSYGGSGALRQTASHTIAQRRLAVAGVRDVLSYGGTTDVVAVLEGLIAEHPHEDTTVVLVVAGDRGAQAEVIGAVAKGARPLVVEANSSEALRELLAPLVMLDPAPRLAWAATTQEAATELGALVADMGGLARWEAPHMPVDGGSALWLGDARVPGIAVLTAVLAARRGEEAIVVDGAELRSGVERTERIRSAAQRLAPDGHVVLIGGGADAEWQLDTVLGGTPLPGGGFLPLEDRRIVALYGSPGSPGLGVLGQQDLEATLQRARTFAAGYADAEDGRLVVPGLDVITTIASAAAEPTGDFSRRVPIELLRPLVERAGEEGMAVLLDLQPGRTDFLTQAKEYEELLREPHVHLALDPEWRIGPDERHLRRIGSVEAAEVQAVADWLAALVRRERLPQKVLMLHQFTLGMLPDRDTVVIPPELVGVVHVDGQGSLPAKERTYAVMSAGAEERWAWGWKNFTRIDVPMATPGRTLARDPVPVIVTYQ
jgi:hypothetical protein